MDDPLYKESFSRLNRIRSALAQHVATLESQEKLFSEFETRQKAFDQNLRTTKEEVENDAPSQLDNAVPEIAEQNRIIENIENGVSVARLKLMEQGDMVQLLDEGC